MPQILPAAVHAIVKEKDFKNVHKLLILDKEPKQSWKSNGLTTILNVNQKSSHSHLRQCFSLQMETSTCQILGCPRCPLYVLCAIISKTAALFFFFFCSYLEKQIGATDMCMVNFGEHANLFFCEFGEEERRQNSCVCSYRELCLFQWGWNQRGMQLDASYWGIS